MKNYTFSILALASLTSIFCQAGVESSGGGSGWIKYSYYVVEFKNQTATITESYNPPNMPKVIANNLKCENAANFGIDADLFCYTTSKPTTKVPVRAIRIPDYLSVTRKGDVAVIQQHFKPPTMPQVIAKLKCQGDQCVEKSRPTPKLGK